jgi:myosin-15
MQASLLKLDDTQTMLNKMALECFIAIMKFMGDYMAKGKTEMDIVHFLMFVAQKHEELRDEIYCQLIKQTTNNKSERVESTARGWRLLLILTAFIKPSDNFERYLRAYLQNTAFNKDREFQDQAIICLRNLKQTVKIGGRKVFPDQGELNAVLAGKYTKIQKLFLPGDRTKSIKIHAATSVLDVVRQMCEKMDVTAVSEFGIYICMQTSEHGTPLQPTDYILDSTTILEKKNLPYRLYFRKVCQQQKTTKKRRGKKDKDFVVSFFWLTLTLLPPPPLFFSSSSPLSRCCGSRRSALTMGCMPR